MKEFKKILFPVDLSESSEKILPYRSEMRCAMIINWQRGTRYYECAQFR